MSSHPRHELDDHVVADGPDELGPLIKDIIKKEAAREFVANGTLCVQTTDGPAFGLYSDDQRLLEYMPILNRLNARVVSGEASPVVQAQTPGRDGHGLALTRLGSNILTACQLYRSYQEEQGRLQDGRETWQEAYADLRFHPVIEVTLRAVMRWWRAVCQWECRTGLAACPDEMQAAEALRDMVSHIRRACRSQSFTNLLQDHEKKARDNFESACRYVTAMFERHSRLLVLRIDLYVRPGATGWGHTGAADRAVVRYLRNLRDGRIVDGFRGFLIKRENGICRGTHYHLMVLLDGHEHRSAWFLTQRLGEAWVKRVGSVSGSYFNCYGMKDRYRFNGLGVVHASDEMKLIGMRVALWYMSKQDCELMVCGEKRKNFWRSPMPAGRSGRGAPRKDAEVMRIVRRALGGKRSKYPPGMEPQKASGWHWSGSASAPASGQV